MYHERLQGSSGTSLCLQGVQNMIYNENYCDNDFVTHKNIQNSHHRSPNLGSAMKEGLSHWF